MIRPTRASSNSDMSTPPSSLAPWPTRPSTSHLPAAVSGSQNSLVSSSTEPSSSTAGLSSSTQGPGGSGVPRTLADYYFSQVPGSTWNSAWNQYQYPCSESLPDLTIGIGAVTKFTLPGSGLVAFSLDGTNCLSKLGVSNSSPYFFAQNLMEELFIVFDFDNAQIGFGEKPKSGSSPGTGITPGASAPSNAGSVR